MWKTTQYILHDGHTSCWSSQGGYRESFSIASRAPRVITSSLKIVASKTDGGGVQGLDGPDNDRDGFTDNVGDEHFAISVQFAIDITIVFRTE